MKRMALLAVTIGLTGCFDIPLPGGMTMTPDPGSWGTMEPTYPAVMTTVETPTPTGKATPTITWPECPMEPTPWSLEALDALHPPAVPTESPDLGVDGMADTPAP